MEAILSCELIGRTWKYWLVAIILPLIVIIRFCTHQSSFKRLLYFIVSPKRFVALCVEDTIDKNIQNDQRFKERIESDGNYKKIKMEEYRSQFSESTNKLRNSIYRALITIFWIFICAFLSAFLAEGFISITSKQIILIQMISAFLILWALVGKLGWSIQTIDGNTPPEQINNFWFIFLNVIGGFCLFFTYFYNLFKK